MKNKYISRVERNTVVTLTYFWKPLFRGNFDPFVNNANLGAIAHMSNGTEFSIVYRKKCYSLYNAFMVRRLSTGKNNHLTCYSLAINPRYVFIAMQRISGLKVAHMRGEMNISMSHLLLLRVVLLYSSCLLSKKEWRHNHVIKIKKTSRKWYISVKAIYTCQETALIFKVLHILPQWNYIILYYTALCQDACFPKLTDIHFISWSFPFKPISNWIDSFHIIYLKSNFNFRYIRLCDLNIPRVKKTKLLANKQWRTWSDAAECFKLA